MELLYVAWPLLSLIIGAIGSSRQIGFFGSFAASLFLSPVIGLIVTMLSKTEEEVEREKQTLATLQQQAAQAKAAQQPTGSVADELIKLKGLLDAGAITQHEYEVQKGKLLN